MTMRHLKLQIAVLCGFALVFSLAAGIPANDELAEITRASNSSLTTLTKALATEDSGLLASLFTSNGSIHSSNGYQVSGRLSIRMASKMAMLSSGGGKLSVIRDTIALIDSAYQETGAYTFRVSAENAKSQKTYRGHYQLVWSKEDKVWKISRAVGLK